MATVYKRGGKQNRGGKWYIQFFDENGRRRTVRGCTDKDATLQIARKLEADVVLRKTGIIDPKAERYAEEGRRPITEQIEDWKRDMVSRGVSEKQVRLAFGRVTRVLDSANIRRLVDVTPSAVQNAIGKLRDAGRSAKTLNDTLASVKQFCRWARRDGRIAENPIDHLRGFNTAVDRRHDRRALSDEELRCLFAAAENGPTLQGCHGPERALIYRLAALTGLRANEIATLKRKSFDLDGSPPTVTVEAAFSKHRRRDVQPIPAEIVPRLREHLATKNHEEPAFDMPKKPIEALRPDLRRAGIPYETDRGYADFHALRHTYITRLIKAGINPKTAQILARHHDVSLTLNVYTHIELIDQGAALKALPKLDMDAPDSATEYLSATGTHGPERDTKATGIVRP
ncbi:MAG: site-specific integrase [bacterium]